MRILACLGLLVVAGCSRQRAQENPIDPKQSVLKSVSAPVDDEALFEAHQKALNEYPDREDEEVAVIVGKRFGVSGQRVVDASDRVFSSRSSQQARTATEVIQQKPISSKQKNLPSPIDDAKLFEAYQKALWRFVDREEDAVAMDVGRQYGVSGQQVQDAWKRVYIQRSTQRVSVEKKIKQNLTRAFGAIESVVYEPINAVVVIKIKARDNLTAGLIVKSIKRDLITSTHAGFQAAPAATRVQVWVIAPTTAGVIKVASSSVDRSLYQQLGSSYFKHPIAANVTRLRPWFHSSMK